MVTCWVVVPIGKPRGYDLLLVEGRASASPPVPVLVTERCRGDHAGQRGRVSPHVIQVCAGDLGVRLADGD